MLSIGRCRSVTGRIGVGELTRRSIGSMSVPNVLDAVQGTLEAVSVDAGLGWTAAIVSCTLALRTAVTLPLMVSQLKTAARIELEAKPQVEAWRERIKGEIFRQMKEKGIRSYKGLVEDNNTQLQDNNTRNNTNQQSQHDIDIDAFQKEYETRVKEKALSVYREHGYRPVKALLLPLTQIPLWITLSLALRRMVAMPLPLMETLPEPLPGLADAGYLWFTDLTQPDSTWIFPVVIGASYLLNVELGLLSRKTELTRFQRTFTNSVRVLSVFMIFVAKQVPMALTLYWATSALYSLGQNIAFKLPPVKRAFGIRETPSEKQTSLSALISAARGKLLRSAK